MRIIAGTARGTVIDAPLGRDTRPTLDRVRENVFNILQQQVRGARVLDLFSGSGAMAFEAVSRGAASAVLVDVDKKAHQVEEANCRKLRMDDRCRWIGKPPYRSSSTRTTVSTLCFLIRRMPCTTSAA